MQKSPLPSFTFWFQCENIFIYRWVCSISWTGCDSSGSREDQFSSVAQSCPTLCDPMNRSMPGLPVHHQLPEFMNIESVMPSSHLILCLPLLLLPPIPPSIRDFSNESALRMRWPKYWSFIFSIIPSKEIPENKIPSLHGKQMGKQWKQCQTLFFFKLYDIFIIQN